MKKIIAALLVMFSLALVLAPPADAAEFDLVADGAGLLTDEEYWEAEQAHDVRRHFIGRLPCCVFRSQNRIRRLLSTCGKN